MRTVDTRRRNSPSVPGWSSLPAIRQADTEPLRFFRRAVRRAIKPTAAELEAHGVFGLDLVLKNLMLYCFYCNFQNFLV
jgi:hypothetical protein